MIYLAIIMAYVLLIVSLVIKESTLGLISSMMIMFIGVYVGINGIEFLNNLLTQSFAIISIGVGAYFLIAGSLIQIEESGI